MRVVITGATGFLGGALARELAREGAELHALYRPTSDRSALSDLPVTWHLADVTAPESLKGLFRGADGIVHAAGQLGQSGIPEEHYRKLNVEGTSNVLAEALASAPRARVLYLSSPGVLGATSREPADERAPYNPNNHYERSKTAAEQVALGYALRGLPVVVARPGFVYGPGDRHVLGLFRAVQSGRFFLIDGGRSLCQPTFVGDAVAGMSSCLRRGRPGELYHLVGPRSVSFRELAETIAAALGVRAPWLSLPRWSATLGAAGLEVLGSLTGRTPPLSRTGVSFFAENRVFSWRKAADELGYNPRQDLAAGVAETVAWYRRQGWL